MYLEEKRYKLEIQIFKNDSNKAYTVHANMRVKELVIFRQYSTYLSVFFITFDINFDVETALNNLLRLSSEFSHELCDFSAVGGRFMLEETLIYQRKILCIAITCN